MRRSERRRTLVLTVCVVTVAITASSAGGENTRSSVGRERADAIASRVLRPQADKGEVILFGLPAPLRAGSVVAPADPPRGDPTRKARVRGQLLSAPAWLYWLDRDPYARFSHDSEYLLVDDRTGRVVHRAKIGWYPTIGGKDPAFLSAAGYEAKRHRIFARVAPLRSPSSVTRELGASTVPAGAFANDCLLMVGDYHDAAMRNDFPAVERWAKSVGLRSFYTTPAGPKSRPEGAPPDAAALKANVKELVEKNRCLDILVYMSGHGVKAGSGPPTVMTGKTVRPLPAPPFVEVDGVGIDASELEDVVKAFPTTTFKVKIDSCFSGRFMGELAEDGKPRQQNLLILEVSSGPNHTSLSRGARSDTPYPERIGTFTRQNLVGLRTWAAADDEVASSAALGGSLLAHALERAYTLGRPANVAISRGKVPMIATNFLPLAFTRSSWQHPAGSTSSVTCAEVQSEAGTTVNVAVSTGAPRQPEPSVRTVTTGANGRAVASFKIFFAGGHAFGAAGRKGPRTARAAPLRTTIPPPPQQPPAGSLTCPAP
jgi:hypothetical protein